MKVLLCCIAFIFSSLLLSTSLFSQERLKPSKTETLATFTFLQPNSQPFANEVVLFKGNKGSKVSAKTNTSGLVKTLLPNNENFTTTSGEYLNDRLIKTGNKAYSAIGGKRYTHRFIEYSFYYKNTSGEAVKDELVTIISNTGKTYTQTTTADGLALFYLPIQEKYTVNLTYYPNARTIEIPDAGYSYLQMSYSFYSMSSLETEQSDISREKSEQEERQREETEKADRERSPTIVVFFASQAEYKSVGTITVYDGGKGGTVVGEVRAIWNCTNGPNKKEQIEAKVIKMKGTYTYYAKSTQGIEWEGTYEVLGGGQKNIPLRIKHK